MAGARRFDDNAMRAGTKAAGGPGWRQEAIMSDRCRHPQCGPGLASHRWFGAKLFVLLAAPIVAAYVTAKLLLPDRPLPCAPRMDASRRCR